MERHLLYIRLETGVTSKDRICGPNTQQHAMAVNGDASLRTTYHGVAVGGEGGAVRRAQGDKRRDHAAVKNGRVSTRSKHSIGFIY